MGNSVHKEYSFFFKHLFILFIYFWPHRVFVAARGISLVAASRGHSSLRCVGFSLRWPLLLQSTGSRHAGFSSCGSRTLERRLSSCGSRVQLLCGMWDPPGQGSNPCPLHWQADSQPLRHQGSPRNTLLKCPLGYGFHAFSRRFPVAYYNSSTLR